MTSHFTGLIKHTEIVDYDKKNLVSNIAGAMNGIQGAKRSEMINRQLCHFFRADIGLGMAVVHALGISPEQATTKQHNQEAKVTV
jgi:catalase